MKVNKISVTEKMIKALSLIYRCVGKKGIWADPSRYAYQNWTRDMALATAPVFLQLKMEKAVRTHLINLSKRQRDNGQIPILFLDRIFPFLKDKIMKSFRDKKVSFMLGRLMRGKLWNLTPGTKDSELLYIIAMYEYAKQTGDWELIREHELCIDMALQYIEMHLINGNGFIIGCDWRDTMHEELKDKALLSNNSLLYHAYVLLGETSKADRLKEKINKHFFVNGQYVDYLGSNRFDALGGSLAVLYDIVPPKRYHNIVNGFNSVDTPYGVTIKCKHNPTSTEEAEIIKRTDGVVVWPFIVGFSILAMNKIGQRGLAEKQFKKLLRLHGFHEWHDPNSGQGYGATGQLWSAALFLRVIQELNPIIIK